MNRHTEGSNLSTKIRSYEDDDYDDDRSIYHEEDRQSKQSRRKFKPRPAIFKIYIDDYARPAKSKTQEHTNWVATCYRADSKVVRVPDFHYVKQGKDDSGYYMLVKADPNWIAMTRQSVILRSLADHREKQSKELQDLQESDED